MEAISNDAKVLIGRRRQRTRPTREETRERILEGATKAFAERGFHGASQDDICARVGLTRGAFNSSFKSKEELFFALYDKMIDEVRERFDTALRAAEKKGAPSSRAFFEEFVRHIPFGRDWHLLNTEFNLHAIRNPSVADRLAVRRNALVQTIAEGVTTVLDRQGRRLAVDPHRLARLLLAIHDGSLAQSLVEPGKLSPDEFLVSFGSGVVDHFSM